MRKKHPRSTWNFPSIFDFFSFPLLSCPLAVTWPRLLSVFVGAINTKVVFIVYSYRVYRVKPTVYAFLNLPMFNVLVDKINESNEIISTVGFNFNVVTVSLTDRCFVRNFMKAFQKNIETILLLKPYEDGE